MGALCKMCQQFREVMVDAGNIHLIRERESIAQLWMGEHLLP